MNNRSRLLETAKCLFAHRGYHSVGVQEIVRRTNLTKPTLYHFFGSKAGLLGALFEEGERILRQEAGEALVYQGDLTQTLEELVRAFFRFSRRDEDFCRLFLALFVTAPDDEAVQGVFPVYQALQQDVEALFRQAAQDHGNMRGREELTAASFLGMVYIHLGMVLSGRQEMGEDRIFWMVKQFIHGILS